MEGSLFYWILWFVWVYLTFLLNRQNGYRLKLSAAVLTVIILSVYHIHFAGIDINLSGIFVLFLTYVTFYNEKTSSILYFFICSFIVMIAYVSFHLFEIFDPVWLIFTKEWMLGICMGYLAILLQKNVKGRLLIMVSGSMQGEMLYAYILSRYGFPYQIGSLAFLDALSLTSLLIICWSLIENAGSFFEGYFNAGHKDKQKSS